MKKSLCALLVLQTLLVATMPSAHADRRERRYGERSRSRAEQPLERVRAIMLPLLQVTDQRISLEDVKIALVDDPAINAGSAGNGEFLVTTGLLRAASDDQLRGVLAHEIAHDDLNHPSKAQVINTGVGIGTALLEKVFPGSSAVAPLAGTLVNGHYSRPMELAADRHAVKLLQRAGYSKRTLVDTLAWLMQRNGDSGGGLLASHPATSERIQALNGLR